MTPFNRLQCVIDFLLCSINPVRNNWFMSSHASSWYVNRSNYQSTCSSHDYVSDSEENICSIQMQIIRHVETWCLGSQELWIISTQALLKVLFLSYALLKDWITWNKAAAWNYRQGIQLPLLIQNLSKCFTSVNTNSTSLARKWQRYFVVSLTMSPLSTGVN